MKTGSERSILCENNLNRARCHDTELRISQRYLVAWETEKRLCYLTRNNAQLEQNLIKFLETLTFVRQSGLD